MDRRKLLTTLTIGVIPTSGCFSESKRGQSQPASSPPANTSDKNTAGNSESPKYSPEYTYVDLQVGDEKTVTDPEKNQPHEVGIWNDTSETLGITVDITERPNESAVVSGTYQIPSAAALSITLLEPANYLLRIQPVTTDAKETLQIPRERFDCNASTTHVEIRDNGRIKSTLVTTTMDCD